MLFTKNKLFISLAVSLSAGAFIIFKGFKYFQYLKKADDENGPDSPKSDEKEEIGYIFDDTINKIQLKLNNVNLIRYFTQ